MSHVLIAGETWMSYGVHMKGFSTYSTGYYHEGARPLVEALTRYGHRVTFLPNHIAVESFPSTLAELREVAVVVLSDIPSDTLLLHPDTFERGLRTSDRLALLREWVSLGGGLLMIGGYMSFSGFEGKAKYQNTALADVLPVTMLGYDDRIESPAGVTPVPVTSHAVLRGIEGRWPPMLGYNRLIAKADSTVVLEWERDPLLILGRHGSGRVGAFAPDCTPHWGSPEFTAWSHYGQFWSQLVDWLSAGDAVDSTMSAAPAALRGPG